MNLKELRISKGLTQTSASKIVNVPLRTYKRYENDLSLEKSFKYKEIYKIIKEQNKSNIHKIKTKSYKIAVAGIGYVGLSLGVLLSQNNDVTLTDIIVEKIELVNARRCPFHDSLISDYLINKNLRISATYSEEDAYKDKDIVIIATPTDFDPTTNSFNVDNVVAVLDMVNKVNKTALVVIKSTIPISFTDEMKELFPKLNIIFSPEFSREGLALYDNLYPSRIIIGCHKVTKRVERFAQLLENGALNMNKALFMSPSEAEAVKLFSNAYLAMRVAFFNELDSYAKNKDLNTANIIKGMSRDERIGDYYNNPSFGYGGYCLPKDSEQLQSSFIDIPNNNLIKAIVDSNQTRKEFIADDIINTATLLSKKYKDNLVIGIYSLAMKSGSDNYRSSASVDIMNILLAKGVRVVVYDKSYQSGVESLEDLKEISDLIITNRYAKELSDVSNKLYTRDIYQRD